MNLRRPLRLSAAALAVACLAACGGGGGSSAPASAGPSVQARTVAATSTAQGSAECVAVQPFYWEIGDAGGRLASGSAGGSTYQADTVLPIASASKWIYSSYYVQRSAGVLSADDLSYFNFLSGYTNFTSCSGAATVGACLSLVNRDGTTNGQRDPATVGRFDYGGGHMQVHAANHGLAALDNAGLAAEMQSQIGRDIAIAYGEPQLAGGVRTSAAEYAKLLRKIVAGELRMHDALGTHAVCASPNVCPTQAIASPAPPNESWQYAVGHWVEDRSNVSDGAFSSPGAFGFYPWIDKTRTWYGVVSRLDLSGAIDSVKCGRLIRRAWVTGEAQ